MAEEQRKDRKTDCGRSWKTGTVAEAQSGDEQKMALSVICPTITQLVIILSDKAGSVYRCLARAASGPFRPASGPTTRHDGLPPSTETVITRMTTRTDITGKLSRLDMR